MSVNVWGPPIVAFNGCRCYISFVDHFCSFTWIYLLKTKSGCFSAFLKFKNEAENILSTRLKILQSDGGSEFTSKRFTDFLSSHGIIHRISCPTNPKKMWWLSVSTATLLKRAYLFYHMPTFLPLIRIRLLPRLFFS